MALEDDCCSLCNLHAENETHLFLHCDTSKEIWLAISQWINLTLPNWSSFNDLWAWIDGVPIIRNQRLIVTTIVFSSLWSIWRLRNSINFKDKSFRKCHVVDNIKVNGFNWLFSRFHKKRCNWNQWLQSPLYSL
ncbi:uncharacterized protein [Rutidosis leptorrhynchoides]|uniref:uncharacterized protein n=1 Tax=Rutidosis leptorrhynchoides TaxID=125765 RepID=UPI003A993665